MPYPTVPDLTPFEGQQRPSLLAGGPYDEQLTVIEQYLNQLGAYVDGEIATLDAKIDEVEQTLTAKIDALADNVAAIVTALSGVTYTYAETPYALFEGLTPTGGTVTSPALTQISTQLEEIGNEVNTISQVQENMLGVSFNVPDTYSDGKFTSQRTAIFKSNGTASAQLNHLFNALNNLALAAPNGDHTQVLGDIGISLTNSSTEARSSAALTYAAEQPSYEGSVYGVPVDVTSEGLVTLAVAGEFVIHQNETLFVCSSEYDGFPAGSVVEYTGADTVTLNQTGTDLVSSLVTVYEPTGSGGGTGTLSLSENGVLLDNGEPVTTFLLATEVSLDGSLYTGFKIENRDGEKTACVALGAENKVAEIMCSSIDGSRLSLSDEHGLALRFERPDDATSQLTTEALATAKYMDIGRVRIPGNNLANLKIVAVNEQLP